MAKYVKIEPIEAVQFDPCGKHKTKLPDGVVITKHQPGADNHCCMGMEFGVETLEGMLAIQPGDYVATGSAGEHWPIRRDRFEATYRLAASEGGGA